MIRVHAAADRRAAPWRNGGGRTWEVAREPDRPGDDFDWRVSIAEVARDGAFSTYGGVDRVIVLVEGTTITLTIGGVAHVLRPFQPFRFDGAAPVHCALPAGAARALNVMTRRAQVAARVEIHVLTEQPIAGVGGTDPLVLIALQGSVRARFETGDEQVLGPLDALSWAAAGSLTLTGSGRVAAVHLTRTPAGKALGDERGSGT